MEATNDKHTKFGTFVKFFDLASASEWPTSSDTRCIIHQPQGPIPETFFFISHSWLSVEHPDPEKNKLQLLKRSHLELLGQLERAKALDEHTLTRETQIELLHERAEIPIMGHTYFNEWKGQREGYIWLHDGAHAGARFKDWLIGSLESAIYGELWIDSYALPNKTHRSICDTCRNFFDETLYRIYDIVSKSTCISIGGNIVPQTKRGWLMLESSVASMFCRLIQSGQDWNMKDTQASLERLEYSCTEHRDGIAIAEMYCIARIQEVLEDQNRIFSDIYKPLPIDKTIQMIQHIVKDARETYEDNIYHQLKHATTEICRSSVVREVILHARAFTSWGGRLMTMIVTWSMAALLYREARESNITLSTAEASTCPPVILQSCIIYFVCTRGFNLTSALGAILTSWKVLTKAPGTEGIYNTFSATREIKEITDIYQKLMSGEELDIKLHDYHSLMDDDAKDILTPPAMQQIVLDGYAALPTENT